MKIMRAALSVREDGGAGRLRPPWSLGEAAFLARCTGCGDCIDACPESILVPWRRTPVVDFRQGECTFCGDCARACGEGVFRAPESGPPWSLRAVIGSHCLSLHGVECRLCADQCETRALRFRPAPGGVARIEIDPSLCTGCGACVAPCPEQAIEMRTNGGVT